MAGAKAPRPSSGVARHYCASDRVPTPREPADPGTAGRSADSSQLGANWTGKLISKSRSAYAFSSHWIARSPSLA